jgi:hypothetical protein
MNTEQYELRYHPNPCRHPDADMFLSPDMTFASLTCIGCGEDSEALHEPTPL